MSRTIKIVFFSLLLIGGANALVPLEDAIYTNDYYISFYPTYPLIAGEKITIRLRTFSFASKVTLYSDRSVAIPMTYREGYWWGKFQLPDDYQLGWHYFHVWMRQQKNWPARDYPVWSRSRVWYRLMARPLKRADRSPITRESIPPEAAWGNEQPGLTVTGEAFELATLRQENIPLIVKGAKSLSFTSRSLEGSRDGYSTGLSREESLRLSVAGRADETEIEANLISTSVAGSNQNYQRDDKVSILVKRASTEAYFGDFTAELNETEFARLNKVLSGVRLKGKYGLWNATALYSSPKGQSRLIRFYGDGTQGPYRLGAAQKVVVNSERIVVDGGTQRRGDDYTIDYDAGTVTFKRRTILSTTVVEVHFDDAESNYQHVTYAFRPTVNLSPNAKIGATLINDADGLQGVTSVTTAETLPQSHYVVGIDGSLITDSGAYCGELAYSDLNPDLYSGTLPSQRGKAYKLVVSQQLGSIGLTGALKKIDPEFTAISDPTPKQDLWQYGGGLSYRPNSLFGARVKTDYQRYLQAGTSYLTELNSAGAGLTPDHWPSLEYEYSQTSDSNDPVSGDPISRVITRKAGESNWRLGPLSTSVKAAREEWVKSSPSLEATNYNKANFGLATLGNDRFSMTSNVELEDREEPTGERPNKKRYTVNLAATPNRTLFTSLNLDHSDDSALGVTDVADLAYRAEASELFRTDGKYSISSLTEDYATTEAVSKQSGSFAFDLRPSRLLRLKYTFKPNFTKLLRLDRLTYFNEQSQAEVNLVPNNSALISLLQKYRHAYTVSKQAGPDYRIKENTADSVSTLYSLKLAPLSYLSTEFNYQLENGVTTTLTSLEAQAYQPGENFGRQFEAIVRTSVSERFSIDSRYAYQRVTQGNGGDGDNVVNTVSHFASLKGLYNYSPEWSFSLSGGYSKNVNNLTTNPISYTVTPGFGVIYRYFDRLRVDFDWLYAKSYQGLETERYNYALKARYSISDYVNASLRFERETSPDYKTTELSGNVEINL
ncbi:MAG: hypothetical protein WCW67_07980 [Candidatus Margulisiibacteriota bacterium]|jgi:hypothetical protein